MMHHCFSCKYVNNCNYLRLNVIILKINKVLIFIKFRFNNFNSNLYSVELYRIFKCIYKCNLYFYIYVFNIVITNP